MASSLDLQSRLQTSLRTETGSFSQVVAITQSAINSNLKTLFVLNPELAIVRGGIRNGEIDAKLSSAMVSFPSYGEFWNYHCTFKSGKLKLWDGEPSASTTTTIDITDWSWVCQVEPGQANVPRDSSEYESLRKLFNHPGDYSISRLHINLKGQRVYFNRGLSFLNGYQWNSIHHEGYFVELMSKWCQGSIAEPSNTTMGYSAYTNNPNSVNSQAPTFPPTSSTIQYYHYRLPGSTPGGDPVHTGLDQRGGKNMLLYLEMTQKQKPPIERSLNYSGNFVIPGMSGTICISRDVFWDSFLLRSNNPFLLQLFNLYTHAWVKSVKVENGVIDLGVSAEYGVGPRGWDQNPYFYKWDQDGESSWKWDKNEYKKDDQGWEGVWDGILEMWCDTHNQMSAQPGTCNIKISGSTRIAAKANAHRLGVGEGYEVAVTMKWSVDASLVPEEKGGLSVSLDMPNDQTQIFKVESHLSSWPLDVHNDAAEEIKDRFKTSINEAPFHEVVAKLKSALKNTARFVLPGSGTFFFKDPKFNNVGDVLLEVRYDGAQ